MIEITKELVKNIIPARNPVSNKADFGKTFCITGSNTYIGAGILSGLAALKVGSGYSFLCSEKAAIEHYKNFSADLIYKSHNTFNPQLAINIIETIKPSAIVFGCGIGFNKKTLNFTDKIINFLKNLNIPVILDADALNCLAELDINDLNKNFILTPHPKELSRLLKLETADICANREQYAKLAHKKYNATIVLKGANTAICSDTEELYINPTGNNSLAKAGTGDILAGMIGGFLSQSANVQNAAICATYLHGLAADLYQNDYTEYSMLASDLLNYIPLAIKQILSE